MQTIGTLAISESDRQFDPIKSPKTQFVRVFGHSRPSTRYATKSRSIVRVATPKAGPSPSTPNLECCDLSPLLDLSDGIRSGKIKQNERLAIKSNVFLSHRLDTLRRVARLFESLSPKLGQAPALQIWSAVTCHRF